MAGMENCSIATSGVEPENNTFPILVADITHRCNMACANCYIPNRDIPDMDVGRLYAFLRRLPNRTIIRLIGAEPTMRKDLPDIIRGVKRCGHHVSLTTNGLKLASIKYLNSLRGLSMVCISMNGAADPTVYEIMDGGREYAGIKVEALKNCMRRNILINTGTIIANGVNEQTVREQVDLFRRCASETGYAPKVKPLLRFKSVGKIGRNMGRSLTMGELSAVLLSSVDEVKRSQVAPPNHGRVCNIYELPDMYIRLVDWNVDRRGVPDAGSKMRGRITDDWKCAPFFENVKKNEFGY